MENSKIRIRVNIDSPDVDSNRNFFYKYVLWRKVNTMNELSANKKLDIVLKCLYNNYYDAKLNKPIDVDEPISNTTKSIIGKKRLSLMMIISSITLADAVFNIENPLQFKPEVGEVDLIVEYLYINGYIDKVGEDYGIVYEGMILVENGGFESNAKSISDEHEKQNRREIYLIFGSWMAGIGALLIFLKDLIKDEGWILSVNFLTDIFVYSSGICTGLLALLIADKVLHQRSKE